MLGNLQRGIVATNSGRDSANNIAINLKLEKTISRKFLQKERRVEFIYRANDQITICLDG